MEATIEITKGVWFAASMLATLGAALGCIGAVMLVRARRLARACAQSHAASGVWPPPYAASKGMEQDLKLEGFALTHGNGSAFVHMRPLTAFGPDARVHVLEQLLVRAVHATEDSQLKLRRAQLGFVELPVPGEMLERMEALKRETAARQQLESDRPVMLLQLNEKVAREQREEAERSASMRLRLTRLRTDAPDPFRDPYLDERQGIEYALGVAQCDECTGPHGTRGEGRCVLDRGHDGDCDIQSVLVTGSTGDSGAR